MDNLEWLARNVHEWEESGLVAYVFQDDKAELTCLKYGQPVKLNEFITEQQWLDKRSELGIDTLEERPEDESKTA